MHYVMSDIHGQGEKYDEMLSKIHLKDDDTLIVLGDIIDRGPDSIRLLLDIMHRDNAILIMGNHEVMMLEYLEKRNENANWFDSCNGGIETYKDFEKLSPAIQNEIEEYLESLYLFKTIEIGDTVFQLSHASASSDIVINKKFTSLENDYWITWGYDPNYNKDFIPFFNVDRNVVFINGHIMVQNIIDEGKIIINKLENNTTYIDIDCGMAMGKENGQYVGKLACLRLEDMKEIYV